MGVGALAPLPQIWKVPGVGFSLAQLQSGAHHSPIVTRKVMSRTSISTASLWQFLSSKGTVTFIDIVTIRLLSCPPSLPDRYLLRKRKENHIHRCVQFFTWNLRELLDLKCLPGTSLSLFFTKDVFKYLFLISIMSEHCVSCAHRGRRRKWGPLELVLQKFVSCNVDAGN